MQLPVVRNGSPLGYTIIEVMIFLAITSILFVSALTLVQGQQAKTQFNQSMRDTESKINQYINEVGTGFFPNTGNYTCLVLNPGSPTDPPILQNTGNKSAGTSQDCIYLGKALQFYTDPDPGQNDKLYNYTVIGRRSILETPFSYPGSQPKNVAVTSFAAARPTWNYPSFKDAALFEEFTIPWGAKIVSICTSSSCTATSDDSALAGFYVSLDQAATVAPAAGEASRSASIVAYQYPGVVKKDTGLNYGVISECIKMQITKCGGTLDVNSTPPKLPNQFSSWRICFKSGASRQSAALTLTSSSIGIKTDLKYFNGVTCT